MKLITEASAEKLRGGFYTPLPLAEFILKWAVNGDSDLDILEPSCGDGVFIEAIKDLKLAYKSITAIEFDSEEATKAQNIKLKNTKIINADFHEYCNTTKQKFDVVVGNPPYIRYQYFEPKQQIEAEDIFIKAGLKYTRLTNAWVSFIVGATLLLKETGRIGFVIPAEILQVSYAEQLRNFIAKHYNKINIVSFEKLVFPNIQQEVVLLLCEKNGTKEHKIEHIELRDAAALKTLDISRLKRPQKDIDVKSKKWTYYFLEQDEIDFLNSMGKGIIPKLGDFANVEVGITTGANDFFTVPLTTVQEYDLADYARPMVGRSVQVNSIIFTGNDWELNRQSKAKAHLLVFPQKKDLNPKNGAVRYIAHGESEGINKGYKCGIREDWFVVPSIKASDALFIRRNNVFPRLIINEAKAYTTDTMHRVYTKGDTDLRALTASFYNSLSLAFSEITGRSYGGGVLELMPSEVERILLPYREQNAELLTWIDEKMRNKAGIDVILKHTNEIILKEGYGLSNEEILLANNIWKKLSNRRLNRK
jgi:adenine-specific DNA-methyltransferase